MRFNLTIGRRLALGFGFIILSIVLYSFFTYMKLSENRNLNQRNSKIFIPSIIELKDLQKHVTQMNTIMTEWLDYNLEQYEADKIYTFLEEAHRIYYDDLKPQLSDLQVQWDEGSDSLFTNVSFAIDTMISWQKKVMVAYADRSSADITELDLMRNDYKSTMAETGERSNRVARINESGGIGTVIKELTKTSKILSATLNDSAGLLQVLVLVLGIILLVVGFFIAFYTYRSIVNPINNLKGILLSMGRGVLPKDEIPARSDEIGEMSAALNNLIKGLKDTSDFSKRIGEGQFDSEYTPLSSEDILGNSLLIMRENLSKVAEEDRKRSWSTEGLARFGEILRRNNDDLKGLTEGLIFELVKYLDANQGAVFVLGEDEEDAYMSIASCYAWDRHKYLEQKIRIGDGLVGQAWQEKSTFYLTDVPENYISITSGLGEASPTSILIVPMIMNEEIYGVIELASFHEMPSYKIEFVEKLAETTAATISTVKINEQTKTLLAQTQEASEQLRAQEEELRQNQEEMMATQEEMQRNLDEAHQEIEKLKKK